ncbi:hypothetical protein N7474_005038 [Penicillium riverlandense]|uniref:uncharacterized protein n=1 Tax=Penicillium riverlandense TaxID=1903569 RepID=UPI002548FB65|nr:uncharacterized protein N7474_005038 [Penicillium riverlandense]KAJ5819447.1 hypothetical protein N7474_005038 [Penicillium riverlandense]
MAEIEKQNVNPDLSQVNTRQAGEVEVCGGTVHDAVFGDLNNDGPNYRNVGWIGTVVIMMKTQIGLGVLSIPSIFHTLGMIPGVISLLFILFITGWANWAVGVFKLNHPSVYCIDDAGALMFGKIGREAWAVAFCIFWTLIAGSGMLAVSISLNAVSTHGACTAVFTAVALAIGFSCASIQTLGRIVWLAWVGIVCILISIFTVTISVGVQGRPSAAPINDAIWVSDFQMFNNPSFANAIAAVSTLLFANGATPAYFSIVSEMRDPQHYTRAVLVSQFLMGSLYVTIGVVMYYFCGSYVSSPALGSAGPLVKKAAYGFALPGLIATTTIMIHLPAKFIFIRLLRNTHHLNQNTFRHWITWFACTGGISLIGYIVAEAIPIFDDLLSLIGALLGPVMALQPTGCMWLYDNWSKRKAERKPLWMLHASWAIFVVAFGCFLTVAGTYGSLVGIIASYKTIGGTTAWTCADNSNSV